MNNEQWKTVAKRWIKFFIPPLLIVVLITGYVIFVNLVVGNMTTDADSFNMFCDFIREESDNISKIAEVEINAYGADDKDLHEILFTGEEQAARDSVFKVCHKADTYVSEETGKRCARFYYRWYGMVCVALYDPANAMLHYGDAEYRNVLTKDIVAAKVDNDTQ